MKRLCWILFCLLSTPALQAGADEDWAALTSLDAGPRQKPSTRDDARLLARNHLLLQHKTAQAFLQKYPQDPRAVDARIRLATVVATLGSLDNDQAKVDDAIRQLAAIEASAPADKQADAGFLRVSLYMQSRRGDMGRLREEIVRAARNFQAKYPGDKRGPRLLVEAATVCDDSPDLKISLLDEAQAATNEEALLRRIADDRKRISHLGRPLDLTLTTPAGRAFQLASLRGQAVILVFWSTDSPHSLLWLRDFRAAYPSLPRDQFRVVLINLDTDPATWKKGLQELPAQWLHHFDGRGWEGELPRSLGINALPSVWVLDKKGIVRSINARSNYQTWLRMLSRE